MLNCGAFEAGWPSVIGRWLIPIMHTHHTYRDDHVNTADTQTAHKSPQLQALNPRARESAVHRPFLLQLASCLRTQGNRTHPLRLPPPMRTGPLLRVVPLRVLAPASSPVPSPRILRPFFPTIRHAELTVVALGDAQRAAVALHAGDVPRLRGEQALVAVELCERALVPDVVGLLGGREVG